MFNPQLPEKTNLEREIDRVLHEMDEVDPGSEDYEKMADQLVKLHAMKTEDGRRRVSPDVKANILANLLGILIIVGHERVHIVTSKALSFIRRLG